jgi:regulator of protease activity HflC (stomatin/prohibitin superfamily)
MSMNYVIIAFAVIAALALLGLLLAIRIVQQYELGVHFRLGRVIGVRQPGLRLIVPVIDELRSVSLRIVTMPIPSQEIDLAGEAERRTDAILVARLAASVAGVVDVRSRLTYRIDDGDLPAPPPRRVVYPIRF